MIVPGAKEAAPKGTSWRWGWIAAAVEIPSGSAGAKHNPHKQQQQNHHNNHSGNRLSKAAAAPLRLGWHGGSVILWGRNPALYRRLLCRGLPILLVQRFDFLAKGCIYFLHPGIIILSGEIRLQIRV